QNSCKATCLNYILFPWIACEGTSQDSANNVRLLLSRKGPSDVEVVCQLYLYYENFKQLVWKFHGLRPLGGVGRHGCRSTLGDGKKELQWVVKSGFWLCKGLG
ncbi:hypothetical protein QQP08_020688, partial [Theobroma cacao]